MALSLVKLDTLTPCPADVDPFEQIVADTLGADIGRTGPVGASTSVLLPARDLVDFAVAWLEARFA